MKVYRYPVTKPDEATLIGEKNLKESLKNNSIDFNISINKNAERQSAVSIDFDIEDYEFLQSKILEFFKDRIVRKDVEINELRLERDNLRKSINLIGSTIQKSGIDNINKAWLKELLFHFITATNNNSELIVEHIKEEDSLEQTISKLTRITNFPWEIE